MAFFERYRFQEFAWFPTPSLAKAKEHLGYGAAALHMGGGLASNDELRELLNTLADNQQVKALFIPKCNIGDDGCEILANFLKEDRALKYLFIEENGITDVGVQKLIVGLDQNRTLKTVMMGANDITDRGAAYIGQYLARNKSLKELAFGKDIHTQGAFELAKGLVKNSTLMSLYLLNNDIDKTGAGFLAEIIGRHPTLNNSELVSHTVTLKEFQEYFKKQTEKELRAAFEASVYNNESGPWMRSKIMVVGQGRAGKTATVRSLLGLSFDPSLDSTIGASISQTTTRNSNNQWNKVSDARIDFAFDTASRITALKIARRRNIEAEHLETLNFDAFVKQYMSQSKERDEEEARAVEEHRRIMGSGAQRSAEGALDEELSKKFNAQLVTNKNAELDDISFTLWDYGGQQVFYTLHHLFLSRFGVYLLAFDMRDIVCPDLFIDKTLFSDEAAEVLNNLRLQKDNKKSKKDLEAFEERIKETLKNIEKKKARQKETEEYLLFWLNSVKMHADQAPLMLIGTFFDVVNRNFELVEVNDFISKLIRGEKATFEIIENENDLNAKKKAKAKAESIEKKYNQIVMNNQMYFFPLDNKTPTKNVAEFVSAENLNGTPGKNIDIIRDKIEALARVATHVNQQLSLRWVKCLDQMLQRPESYLKLAEVREIAKNVGISDLAEVDSMLAHFHELGMIVHINSTQNLREVITTKPQWLVDALSKVIRDERLHKFDEEAIKKAGLVKDMNLMFHKAVVTSDWLEYLWPKDQVQFLIDLMRRTMLISDYKFGEFQNETAYLVPSLIKDENSETSEFAKNMLKDFNLPEEEVIKKVDELKLDEPSQLIKTFISPDDAEAIVFDFSKSFLPNGVFQRILCLCVLHSARENNTKNSKVAEAPQLFKNSAVIHMGPGQVFHLFKYELQIVCRVKQDHIKAYKMLQSMFKKMKVDVMGDGLEWDVLFDTIKGEVAATKESKKDAKTVRQFVHELLPFEVVKERQIMPWFVPDRNYDDKVRDEANVNLEDFLVEIDLM